MQSWNTRWIIPSLRSSSARVSPPWCPAGLVSAPPSDLWDTCLLIFIYSFIYSAQILARHTHTQSLVESDCRDEIVHLPGEGEPRETCLDSALLWGHCLANWKISCTLCPWWFKSLSFSLCFFFFFFFWLWLMKYLNNFGVTLILLAEFLQVIKILSLFNRIFTRNFYTKDG